LEALQIGEGVGRTVNGINQAIGSDPISEYQTHIARTRAYIQDAIARLESQSIHPFAYKIGPLQLARVDFVPCEMAQVFPERLLHRSSPLQTEP
jgi:hypothetical protein